MKIIRGGKTKWQNKFKTFTEKVSDFVTVTNQRSPDKLGDYKDATLGIQSIIKDTVAAGTPLRFLGAGWSWTKIATAMDGVMVDTKQLNRFFDFSAASISDQFVGDPKSLILAQCGMGIWELNDELFKLGRALKTCGASNGQTIVGAMSTGAHGSTIDVGGVQDYVLAIHLVNGPDTHVWLERKSRPVVSDKFIKRMETTLIRDDDMFNAALVSFGSFGFIHGVILETDELYLLETNLERVVYDNKIKKAMSTMDFSGLNLPARPFHFSVSINPYDLSNGVYLYTHYKVPYRTDYTRPAHNNDGFGPGDAAPAFIGNLAKIGSALIPTIVNKLTAGPLKPYSKQLGTLGEIFDNTRLTGKLASTALGLRLKDVTKVADILLDINKNGGNQFIGIFAFRFIKQTKATLGFSQYADFTCVLELDGIFSDATNDFYKAVWDRLDKEKIPFTFHWGKLNQLDFARLKKMYGTNVDAWIAARNKLLSPEMLKLFTNPLLTEWGLDKVL